MAHEITRARIMFVWILLIAVYFGWLLRGCTG